MYLTPTAKLKNQLVLLGQFLKSPLQTAEISSSSKYLIDQIVKKIDFINSKLILELGAGTGVITREIAKHLSPGTEYLVIECNNNFADKLKLIGNVKVIEEDASNLDKHLPYKSNNADFIVSGLPLLVMRKPVVETIIKKCHACLKIDGSLILYQLTLVHKNILKKYFSNVKIQRIWKNIPPYYLITCQKQKESL